MANKESGRELEEALKQHPELEESYKQYLEALKKSLGEDELKFYDGYMAGKVNAENAKEYSKNGFSVVYFKNDEAKEDAEK